MTDIALDSSGHVLALDAQECALRIFDSSGHFFTSLGRRGSGPGEYRLPIKLSVSPDGHVFVYDAGLARLTEYDRQLRFLRTLRLRPMVSGVADLLALKNQILVSGVMKTGAQVNVVGIFDRETGTLVRSFGHLPPASTPAIARLIGAGRIARANDGGLWYVQPAPYLVEKYSSSGELLLTIVRENDFLPKADAAFKVRRDGERTITHTDPWASAFAVHESSDGSLIVQINPTGDERDITDFYGPDYVLRESILGLPILSEQTGDGRAVITGYDDLGLPRVGLVRAHLDTLGATGAQH